MRFVSQSAPWVSILNKLFIVESNLSHFPICEATTIHRDGLCVVLFESESDVQEYFERREIKDTNNFKLLRVGSIYDRMREFADLGYVGFIILKRFPIFWANRISEYNIELPTLSYFTDDDNNTFFIGASGLQKKPYTYKPWRSFGKSDKILRRAIKFHTGFQIDPHNSFYTIVSKNQFSAGVFDKTEKHINRQGFRNGAPLLGPHMASDGAYCVFMDYGSAQQFMQASMINDQLGTKIITVPNLVDYLTWLRDTTFPFPWDIGLNPGMPRYLTGYFFSRNSEWYLRNVFGIYRITNDLIISVVPDGEIVPPEDTVDESNNIAPIKVNLKTTIYAPLDRLMGRTKSAPSLPEAQILVEDEIQNSEFKDTESWEKEIDESRVTINSYLVFGFDQIAGNPFSNNGMEPTPYIFSDILEACCFFYHRLFSFDHEIRLDGYASGPVQQSGTKDKLLDDFLLAEKRIAIQNLMTEILVSGYKPEHSILLMNYTNSNSPVLHIETCGYLGDLAIYNDPIFMDWFSDYDEETACYYKKLRKLSQSAVSKFSNKQILSEDIDKQLKIWLGDGLSGLSIDSQLMLQTAVQEFQNAGNSPIYDYAGISMKLCKVFERELKNKVFEAWEKEISKHLVKKELESESKSTNDQTLAVLIEWLLGRTKIELGSMRYIVDKVRNSPNHKLFEEFRAFIETLPSASFLLSDEFQEVMKQISSRYRNGGVHEYMVSYAVCNDAFDVIVTGKNSAIKRLIGFPGK